MITISLCMIVKNEEKVLSRVLSQMRDIADEIILVDTGSVDRTKEIAKNFTTRIYDFPWIQDFAAARNYACAKATMDYWMWLDADDVIAPRWQAELKQLKKVLDPATDVVMMNYLTAFDEQDQPVFSYYRERLLRNHRGFVWKGRVHEAVTPSGKILYSPIEIEHRKLTPSDPDRNLNIYEDMLQRGEILEPRHQFYYGRELYYHGRFREAADIFRQFLNQPEGWLENKIDACLQLSRCYGQLGEKSQSLDALYLGFLLDKPRPEICCELGLHMMNASAYHAAIYWYQQALLVKVPETSGGFFQKDYQDFIPYLQFCVCYDRLGNHQKALEYHRLSRSLKPCSDAVRHNELYFQ